jgi:hypothetical protein
MFFLFAGLELVEFIYRIQTSENHSFLLFNKQSLLFVKAKYLRYSFFNLSIKIFFLYFDRLLVGYKKYLVPLTIVANFVLIGVFGIASVLGIGNNYISARLAIKIDRFFATSI